eukprot:330954-Pyramimonas_sp.AAC.1
MIQWAEYACNKRERRHPSETWSVPLVQGVRIRDDGVGEKMVERAEERCACGFVSPFCQS